MMRDLLGPFLLLMLSSSAPGLGSVVVKRYQYVHGYYTWDEAQSLCRWCRFFFHQCATQSFTFRHLRFDFSELTQNQRGGKKSL